MLTLAKAQVFYQDRKAEAVVSAIDGEDGLKVRYEILDHMATDLGCPIGGAYKVNLQLLHTRR